jgi:hypothetical protein
MLNLFQSIFGGEKAEERYPESLVDAAIERAVDGTDPRLRVLGGYRKLLRRPVIHAIDHVITLVDALPPPLVIGRDSYGNQPCLSALFASADHMLEVFGHDVGLAKFLESSDGNPERVTALLLAERVEKNVLGMDLVGDSVRRDVAQVSVSFSRYRLVDPQASESESRRALKRRAFDHLLTLALARILDRREERADLMRQRELLKRKLGALQRGGWGFDPTVATELPQAPALLDELGEIENQIKIMGTDADVLNAHLEMVVEVLGAAEHQLWGDTVDLRLDRMNIKREAEDGSARSILLQELHNAQGRRLVMLLVSVAPVDLPKREHFLSAAQRLLV